jgi:hypothetical protein
MDLIPLKTGHSSGMSMDPDAVQMSSEAMALADVETSCRGGRGCQQANPPLWQDHLRTSGRSSLRQHTSQVVLNGCL